MIRKRLCLRHGFHVTGEIFLRVHHTDCSSLGYILQRVIWKNNQVRLVVAIDVLCDVKTAG